MPRQDSNGNLTFAASEVAMFEVCPEMWRQMHVLKVDNLKSEREREGETLHLEWANSFYEAIFLTEGTRFVVMVVLLALLFLILPFTL